MKRLLCIVSSMDRGGAETFLMKVYRNLDHKKYQMDFCVSNSKKGFYDDEIKKMGGKIFVVSPKSKNPIKAFIDIVKVVKNGQYKSVLRTSQQSLATLDLLAAKIGGANKLIYRSSNANITGGKFKKILNKIFGFLPKIVPNVKIAPSTEAAEFVFGRKAILKKQVIILKNGLDYEKFKFNDNIRKKIRKELNIGDKVIFGHVGRFNVQKNHDFLLNIFSNIYKKNPNSRLILIGEGELENDINKKINDLNLSSSVKILGPKANVNEYLMAMDMLIFPSFFEGMPNVIIEAQATGLKCLLSDTITREADITGLLEYFSLSKSAEQWAVKALELVNYERKEQKIAFKNNKYMISDIINIFVKVIFD